MESQDDSENNQAERTGGLIENLQTSLRGKIMDELLKPLPIIPKGSAF
jgi:hypothetical protein